MNDIGDDYKEALQDNGAEVSIVYPASSFDSEYCRYQLNRQVTKPFIRGYFLDAKFSYDTNVRAGDVVQITETGTKYLVTNLTPRVVSNEIISYEAVLYKCNVSGELQRYAVSGQATSDEWDSNYHTKQWFESVGLNCYALLTETLFGNDIETDNELARFGIHDMELFIPSRYGAQIEDRYIAQSGEYYAVEGIVKRRFENVHVLNLREDTR